MVAANTSSCCVPLEDLAMIRSSVPLPVAKYVSVPMAADVDRSLASRAVLYSVYDCPAASFTKYWSASVSSKLSVM